MLLHCLPQATIKSLILLVDDHITPLVAIIVVMVVDELILDDLAEVVISIHSIIFNQIFNALYAKFVIVMATVQYSAGIEWVQNFNSGRAFCDDGY